MGRKKKRERHRDMYTPSKWKELKDYLIIFEGFTKALTHPEIYEITEFIKPHTRYLNPITRGQDFELTDYILGIDTSDQFKGCPDEITFEIYQILSRLRARMSTSDPSIDLNDRFYTDFMMHLPLLSAEAIKKEFTSLLTYVHFIKLTMLKDDVSITGYHIVSEEEQRCVRKWFLMKQNFLIKWGICIEMETPEIEPMEQANVPAAGRLNPVNRRKGWEGDTVESLNFPVLEIENFPTAVNFAIHRFVLLRKQIIAERTLVFMADMPEKHWSNCASKLRVYIQMVNRAKERFNKALKGMLTEEEKIIAMIDDIVKFEGELKGLLSYVTAKETMGQGR